MSKIPLDELSPSQREAVLHDNGPLLVLSGAGSGKTRVVTYRIARLILDSNIQPSRILAVTFTNKAAGEMSERIKAMVGDRAGGLWIGTFHAMCARLLWRHADRLGYPRDFTIYDVDEQRALLKKVIHDLNWDPEKWQPAKVQYRISLAKNHLVTPQEMAEKRRKPEDALLAELYEKYVEALKAAGAMDFDDLLALAVRLFEEHEDVRRQYQTQFEQVIVDEFQDTNEPQNLLTTILALPQRNLCVVGDDDQSIYRWRGAQFKNILSLPEAYPDLRIIRLEQNYRSTTNIVKTAQSVIAKNIDRHAKDLFTTREEGEPVIILEVENEEQEALQVAGLIGTALKEGVNPNGIGILYRTNAQSRVIEDMLSRSQIPYRVIGGTAFYQRKEIKTLLAYLRLLVRPHDDAAFLRVVNSPRRGIGEATLRQLQAKAGGLHLSLFETAKSATSYDDIGSGGGHKLQTLCLLLNRWSCGLEERPLSETLGRIITETDFEEALKKEDAAKAESRIENIRELKSALQTAETSLTADVIRPWESPHPGQPVPRAQKLQMFLEMVTLEADAQEEGASQEAVSLMTLHSAKGLEFSHVFITGMEEGLFPHSQSMGKQEELEEERRLCYVGMTRAKDRLVLSHAFRRQIYGQTNSNVRSRFLDEIPPHLASVVRVDSVMQRTSPYVPGGGPRRTAWSQQTTSASLPNHRPPKQPLPRASAIDSHPGERKQSAVPLPEFLHPGKRVRHRTFGLGIVVRVEGEDPAWRVTVDFQIVGPKTVIQKFARLEPA
jgi:DNA helicase-2/ATP-dependent DNA helicase PcrA